MASGTTTRLAVKIARCKITAVDLEISSSKPMMSRRLDRYAIFAIFRGYIGVLDLLEVVFDCVASREFSSDRKLQDI